MTDEYTDSADSERSGALIFLLVDKQGRQTGMNAIEAKEAKEAPRCCMYVCGMICSPVFSVSHISGIFPSDS
jgi:hypothetical protein